MALIKHASAAGLAREAVVLDLGDLRRQAGRIINEAKAQAARVVSDANRERERLLSDARSEGLESGRREGFEQGRVEGERAGRDEGLLARRAELDELAAAWASALDSFEAMRDRMALDARSDVLELALALAERVTKRAVELDESAVEAQLEAALALVLRPTRLVVRVHPDDRARVIEALPALAGKFEAASHAEVVADAEAPRASCTVRTAGGAIVADIDDQIRRLIEAVRPRGPVGSGTGGGTP